MRTSPVLQRFAILCGVFAMWGCPQDREERLEAVYTANGDIVGKNTASMFDQSIQQGGYHLVLGLSAPVSVARFKLLTYIAWHVEARDATGGSSQDKIRLMVTLGEAASPASNAITLADGGVNRGPALAVHGNRIYCIWTCGNDVCLRTSTNGTNWTPVVRKAPPNGRVTGIDLAGHNDHLFAAGVISPGGSAKLFASRVNVNSSANDFAFVNPNADVVPGDQPSEADGVSLTSDGSTLWLGYVRGGSRLTSFNGTWSLASSLIDAAGSRPALAFSRSTLYACYRNGSSLMVRRRPSGSTAWETPSPNVNDAQANAAGGIDCHKITVLVGP